MRVLKYYITLDDERCVGDVLTLSSVSCRMRPLASWLPSNGQVRPRLLTLHQQHQHLQQLRHGGKAAGWKITKRAAFYNRHEYIYNYTKK